MSGFHGARPAVPSTSQAFVTQLLIWTRESLQELQETFQMAVRDGLMNADDPAMEHFRAAADHLTAAQHSTMAVAPPLAKAEQHLAAFRAAVEQARNASGAASSAVGESHRNVSTFAPTWRRSCWSSGIRHDGRCISCVFVSPYGDGNMRSR